MKKELPEEYIHSLFNYSPWEPDLIWKVNKGKNILIGKKAGTQDKDGYTVISVDRKAYKAHHIIWCYIMGYWPKNQIDHKDQIKGNNRFFNLQEANNSQNGANKPRPKNNTSGYKGVWWHKRRQKYMAQIRKEGKRYHLGYFDCAIEAAKAYDKKAKELYGPFACLNFPNEE